MKNRNREVFRPLEEDRFCFNCYPGIGCFTECCARLRLILTPYDILRIKNRLGLPSDRFLDLYTDILFEEGSAFPLVKLNMDPETGRCPFVTRQGCAIYEDRPGACRLYPLGMASAFPLGGEKTREKFFIVSESHCLGFEEKRQWTISQWLTHEGVHHYNAMNQPWMRIVTACRSLPPTSNIDQKLRMFFMASYNLDRFRSFLFDSHFFRKFEVKEDLRLKLAQDDVALMRFAFNWLRFVLFGEKTIRTVGN